MVVDHIIHLTIANRFLADPQAPLAILARRAELVAAEFNNFYLPTLAQSLREEYPWLADHRLESVPVGPKPEMTRAICGRYATNYDEIIRARKPGSLIVSHFWGLARDGAWLDIELTEKAVFRGDVGLDRIPLPLKISIVPLPALCKRADWEKIWSALDKLTAEWLKRAREREQRALGIHLERQAENLLLDFARNAVAI